MVFNRKFAAWVNTGPAKLQPVGKKVCNFKQGGIRVLVSESEAANLETNDKVPFCSLGWSTDEWTTPKISADFTEPNIFILLPKQKEKAAQNLFQVLHDTRKANIGKPQGSLKLWSHEVEGDFPDYQVTKDQPGQVPGFKLEESIFRLGVFETIIISFLFLSLSLSLPPNVINNVSK